MRDLIRLGLIHMPSVRGRLVRNGEQDLCLRRVFVRIRHVLYRRDGFDIAGIPLGGSVRDVDLRRTLRMIAVMNLYGRPYRRRQLFGRKSDSERTDVFRSGFQPRNYRKLHRNGRNFKRNQYVPAGLLLFERNDFDERCGIQYREFV